MSSTIAVNGNGTRKFRTLDEQVAEVLKVITKGAPLSNQKQRLQVVEEVLSDLSSSFLKCTVLPYGLDEVGIGGDVTTLYLSVDTYGKVDTKSKQLHGSLCLNSATHSAISQQIFRILTINSTSYQYVSIKPLTVYANTAFGNLMPNPVPEISFVHTKTNSNCKIRLENYFCVQKSRLFCFYSRLEIRFWPILMLVRYWGTQFNALSSADTLDFQNYALTLLLVYFLTTKKIIPSVRELQSIRDSAVDKPFIVNNFEIAFCTNVSQVKPTGITNPALQDKELRTLSIVSILNGFFQFCSTFDFKSHVICPFLGEAFKRELFYPKSDWKELPTSLSASYLNGVDGKGRLEKLYLVGPICLQDMFELTTNVTRAISDDEATRFQRNCQSTAKILDEVLNQTENVFLSDAFRNENKKCDK